MKKKLLAIALTLSMCFGATACGNRSELFDDSKTYVYLCIADSGLGRNWAYDMQKRFNEEFKTHKIPGVEGKEGVELIITDRGSSLTVNDNRQSTSMIFEKQCADDADKIKGTGYCYDLTEIMTSPNPYDNGKTIASKIKEEARPWYVTSAGEYYQIPHVEYEPCLTYDKNCFDRNGLYLVNTDNEEAMEGAVEYYSALAGITIYLFDADNFTYDEENEDLSRSIGPDAEWNTYDDGMPMTLLELVALCDYMKNEMSVTPFVLTGKYDNYANWLPTALMNTMLGPDGVLAVYNLDSSEMVALDGDEDHNGKMEVVTGYTSEKLFPGAPDNTIRKPITAWVELTEENGYYHTWAAAKYYAQVFTQLADQMEWFTTKRSSHTHEDAIWEFINSGYGELKNSQVGFLVENSFWCQEPAAQRAFADWNAEYADQYFQEGNWTRDVRIFGLPRTFDLTLEEGGSHPMAGTGTQQGSFFVNTNISGDHEKEEAVKLFLQWWYSDKELENFTKMSNLFRQMDYELSTETLNGMTPYVKSLYEVFKSDKSKGETIYFASSVPTVRENASGLFSRTYYNGAFCYSATTSGSFLHAYRSNGVTALESFQHSYQMVSAEGWKQLYKGSKTLTDDLLVYEGVRYTPLK